MSAKIYVISDTHFGHRNMALHRGFNSVEEHDQFIVDKWNSVVRKDDVVYLLGDITMEKANYEILNQLNGYKKVIQGNHDQGNHTIKLLEYVNSVQSSFKIKGCILTHIPIHTMEMGRYRKCIHGHLHSKHVKRFGFFRDKRYTNVSCEVVNYTPLELKKLL